MRRIILCLALLFAFWARTTDGVLVYTWYWVSAPGQPNGGFWSLVSVEPAL